MKKTINESFYLTNSFIENYKTNLFKSQNHEQFHNCDTKIRRFSVCANSNTKNLLIYNLFSDIFNSSYTNHCLTHREISPNL